MIQRAEAYEIICNGCGKRWGEEEEPERILWDSKPEGIDARFHEVEDNKETEEQWTGGYFRSIGFHPYHWCPECKNDKDHE